MALDLDAINGTTASTVTTTTSEDIYSMSTEQFYDILMAEFTNQNPEDPVSDREFIAQIAQLQAVQETTKQTEAINSMLEEQKLLRANTLLGNEITGLASDGETVVTGVVESIDIVDNEPTLILDTEDEVSIGDITNASLYY